MTYALDGCCGLDHVNRRTILKAAGLSGLGWLTPLAESLARAGDKSNSSATAKSLIVLWMQGGPSQLETFDPKPGKNIAGGSEARDTNVPEVQIGKHYEQMAEVMNRVSLVRGVVSKEGDHERAIYNVKTGFRPDPTLVHPSIGAVITHQLQDNVEIPRHISILSNQQAGRGGYLGAKYDAFKVNDPKGPVPDIQTSIEKERFDRRIKDLELVEKEFLRGRLSRLDSDKTLHLATTQAALKMMSSDQLKAFDVATATAAELASFGDTAFGRGCLAAARLIEVGVRCVEVTLNGWDTHANNHSGHETQAKILDPAFAALIKYLEARDLLDSTMVLWGGEFGRTPSINPAGGRDHWPHGFTVALAGGGIRGGAVIGETSPDNPKEAKDWDTHLKNWHPIADIHATVLRAMGVDFQQELMTPVGRPMIISEGKPISELMA